MTIEGRLDKLTERHEALAQSLELVTVQQEADREAMRQLRDRVDKVNKTVDVLSAGILDLLTIARSHDARLNRLETRAA